MSNLRLLVLIDDSLSMNALYAANGQTRTMLDGSKEIVSHFITEIEQNPRLEVLIQAQSVFIENDDVNKLRFSRDWNQHKQDLTNIETLDKSDFFEGLVKASRLLMGNDVEQPGHLVYLTDGRILCSNFLERIEFLEGCVPGSIHFITLVKSERLVRNKLIEKIVEKVKENGKQASSYILNYADETKNSAKVALELFENEFSPLRTSLKIGKLSCSLCIHPRPAGITGSNEPIEIIGTVKVSDLDGPPMESRHLVQAEPSNDQANDHYEEHLVVLLHNALQIPIEEEGKDKGKKIAALVKVGTRYGVLQPQETIIETTKAKRHWLAFWLFPPGDTPIPWFGPLPQLGHRNTANREPFPVVDSMTAKRSYSAPTTSWAKDRFVNSDITKLLRNARKLPEKNKPFYNELNKVRRAALAYGFNELLEGVAACLEVEQKNLIETKPNAAKELTYAAKELRRSTGLPFDHSINGSVG